MRSQISSQVFIYIAAMVIVAIIAVVGFRLAQSVTKSTKQSEFSKFETMLRTDVIELSEQIGSYRIREYKIPSGYDEICFVDLVDVKYNDILNHPLVKNSVKSGAQENVFFISSSNIESIYIDRMSLPGGPYYGCTTEQKFKLQIDGVEGRGQLSPPPEKRICEIAPNLGCDNLQYGYVNFNYKEKCCELYEICC